MSTLIWRLLSALAALTACAAVTGLLWTLPTGWIAAGTLVVVAVAACLVIAGYADSRHGSEE
ncbi:MAG: hypothetical protein WDA07_05465 [Leucobacter sp.]